MCHILCVEYIGLKILIFKSGEVTVLKSKRAECKSCFEEVLHKFSDPAFKGMKINIVYCLYVFH